MQSNAAAVNIDKFAILTVDDIRNPKLFAINEKRICAQLGNDAAATRVLKEIVFWFAPNDKGKTKLQVKKGGVLCLAKSQKEMGEVTGLTRKQVYRVYQKLIKKDLIRIAIKKFQGDPTCHIFLMESPWGTPPESLFPEFSKSANSHDCPESKSSNYLNLRVCPKRDDQSSQMERTVCADWDELLQRFTQLVTTTSPLPPQVGDQNFILVEKEEIKNKKVEKEETRPVDHIDTILPELMRRFGVREIKQPTSQPKEAEKTAETVKVIPISGNRRADGVNPRARGESPRQRAAREAAILENANLNKKENGWQKPFREPVSTKPLGGMLSRAVEEAWARTAAKKKEERSKK